MKPYLSLLIPTLLLLIAPFDWPYDYYTILRFVVCGFSAFHAWKSFARDDQKWGVALTSIAALFNPLLPIHLEQGTWVIADWATAATLVAYIVRSYRHLQCKCGSNPATSGGEN